jgi:hypothetical protein
MFAAIKTEYVHGDPKKQVFSLSSISVKKGLVLRAFYFMQNQYQGNPVFNDFGDSIFLVHKCYERD